MRFHSHGAGRFVRSVAVLCILCAQLPAQAADLPIRHIVLYKHGLAYIERGGTLQPGEEARLDFRSSDMNDILKSLTVSTGGGLRVTDIRYDSNETIDQKLGRFPFQLGNDQLLSAFLDSLKGAKIEVKTDRLLTGTIIGARALNSVTANGSANVREQMTVLLASGELVNADLGSVVSLRLLDTKLESQLRQYLEVRADGRSKDRRSIFIDTPGHAARDLRVSYVSPAPIWKSSYRLVLGDATSTLEGWAIVDNTTDEDWDNVQLSVVSGRPISFISQLDVPRYGNRPVADLPDDAAAQPVVYGGVVDNMAGVAGSGASVGSGASGGTLGGIIGGVGAAPLPGRPQKESPLFMRNQDPSPRDTGRNISSIEGATGATLGELFEYQFAGPITVKKNQSAMLAFFQDKIDARKLLIYREGTSEHPVNAAEIINGAGKTLDGGPITVYDGGAYAGEALFETVKPGDKRLIGYAVDYGTRVTTAFETGSTSVREIHVTNGILEQRIAQVQTRTYTVRNVDNKPKVLVIEQPAQANFKVISPAPRARTGDANRYELAVAANKTEKLAVKQEYLTNSMTAVTDATPAFLLEVVQNQALGAAERRQLQEIAAIKQRVADWTADLASDRSQENDLNNDQNRWRQNIMSLNAVPGQQEQVARYSSQLAASDAELTGLRAKIRELQQKIDTASGEIRAQIAKLDF